MSYQEQLAYLRQKYGQEEAKLNVPAAPEWAEVDEGAQAAIEERQMKDQWLEESGGYNLNTTVDPRTTRQGQERQAAFEKEFAAMPLTHKYGKKVEDLLGELARQIQDPNSPVDPQQASQLFTQMVDQMREGAFDDEEEGA